MAIPSYQELMLPLLKLAGDEGEYSVKEARESLAETLGLSEEERTALLPSGNQPVFNNRVGWAKTYLSQAGLLESTRRGHFRITARGKKTLTSPPDEITPDFLERFEEFRAFVNRKSETASSELAAVEEDQDTPEETLEVAHQKIRRELAMELLEQVKSASPVFFERLVVELLVRMGYGGSREEAARALGRSGDEGIDGVISEDRLGLDNIYLQAKRWTDKTIGRPDIQQFVGALQGKRARKGVFLTTASFSREAREYASSIDPKVVLLDGEQIADLMIEHGVGVTTVATYEVKRVDSDYFDGG